MNHPAVPLPALAAVLAGAALHAAWNVGIRSGADRRLATIGVLTGAGLIGALVLPFLPVPARASWPHLALSGVIHLIYYNLIAEAYQAGAVSLAYPIMRGAAPALTATAATLGFGERLRLNGWLGLLAISVGVILLARPRGEAGARRAIRFALINAVVIACYTLNDGYGVRLSGAPVSYAMWIFLIPALPSALVLSRFKPARLLPLLEPRMMLRALGGGACSAASYALSLWAMTQAPIGEVAALRETAMLFGVLFAWWFLAERPQAQGILAVAIIAAGAAIVELG